MLFDGQDLDAVVVGAGWAGLAVSSMLKHAELRHLVYEKHRVCETWRTQRWNSFRMNTPNVLTVMPGEKYIGQAPEDYMSRDDFVSMVEDFAKRRKLPIKVNTPVTAVRPDGYGCFDVITSTGAVRAKNVVVATGNLNVAKRPSLAKKLPASVTQLDGSDYREAAQLCPGAVLVIGCGNSGGQIAEDLVRAGRSVFLATGHNGRIPRRYRNRDIVLWLMENGRFNKSRTTNTGRPLLGATHTISLQSLSSQGVVLLGRFTDVSDSSELIFDDDLRNNAEYGDKISADIKKEIDVYIERQGLSVPAATADEAETAIPQFPEPPILRLDLSAHDIRTIIWCAGFRGDFSWLLVPGTIDSCGNPLQEECISVPGVYFAGLDSFKNLKSGSILIAEEESRQIVDHILARCADRVIRSSR